jgi:threonyl-tRNA synthetase
MLHRAIFGSIERFFGILVEHYAGKFPLWLSPRQVCLIPVADRHIDYAKEVASRLQEQGFVCDVDTSNESVSKKVRNAQLLQFNYMLTLGDQEVDNRTINLRTRDNVVHGELNLEDFILKIKEELDKRKLVSLFQKA